MNLIDETPKEREIVLPGPEASIEELLYVSRMLLVKPEWRTTQFSGERSHDQAMWLNEARAKVQRCVGKLEKILEVEGDAEK